MRLILTLLFLWFNNTAIGQSFDFSLAGKTIQYSDTLKKAKKYEDIEKALIDPENVVYLELNIQYSGKNYDKFIIHQLEFKNLRKLVLMNYLDNTSWPIVPDFTYFKKLEFLQVFCISSINLSQLESLTNLKFLHLHACEIKRFPNAVLNLQRLECLNLCLNLLSELPSQIGTMSALRELDLTNNCFESIPKEITQLKALQFFIINNSNTKSDFSNKEKLCKNSLKVYPDFLYACKNLKTVYIGKIDHSIKKKLINENKSIKFNFD